MTKDEVTRETLKTRIEKAHVNVPNAIQQMLEDAKNGRDFMISLGSGHTSRFGVNDFQEIELQTNQENFALHNNAVNQLSGKYGISAREIKKYLKGDFGDGQQGWQDETVAYLLNQHSTHAKQQRFLMRCVGNEVRGVLSEYYKVFDNEILVTEYMKYASQMGGVFAGGHYNGLNIWVEMIHPETITVATENNGDVEIAFGARIKNSEFGSSSFELRSFFMNAVCANGMTQESVIHQRHLGEKLPEGFEHSRELIMANTNKTKLMIRDYTKHLFSPGYVRQTLVKIQQASNIKIDVKVEIEKLKAMGLYKDEIEETQVCLMNNRASDGMQGENTLWKLTQAITAISRTRTEERRRELEEVCGNMLPVIENPKPIFVN